jgi:hypothetical protein
VKCTWVDICWAALSVVIMNDNLFGIVYPCRQSQNLDLGASGHRDDPDPVWVRRALHRARDPIFAAVCASDLVFGSRLARAYYEPYTNALLSCGRNNFQRPLIAKG